MDSGNNSPPWNETPLSQALTFLPVLGSLIWQGILSTLSILYYPLSFLRLPILAPLAILLYVFAPAIVFVQILLEVIIYTPYRVLVYLSDVVYPLYVFCGVACITGVLAGGFGRAMASWTTVVIVTLTEQENEKEQETSRAIEGEALHPKLEFVES
ncbi:hypothetical protein V5O48_004711 [Marasmius crinis-equi]|uniref:Transmembrane protein n=1 Tax=Marasmius crinis-equi TaxID=585013 RepID=A0ABR3FPC3_9AGAR